MKVSRHDLVEVIGERTLHVRDTALLAKEVAAYLLDKRQVAGLDSLIRDILQYRTDRGVVEVNAVSAHELSSEVLADVEGLLRQTYPNAKSVHVNKQLDSEVVGGVRVDLANEVLDLTTLGQLNKFKRLTGAGKE